MNRKLLGKQLEKLDPQIAKRITEDMECLRQDPLQSSAADDPRARRLGLRYIKVAHDWRLFFRVQGRDVLAEFVWHRETGYKELARYLSAIGI
jgi:mRNA-degrading endonuclease YafQ of YafQ-DinJ toxin-antitoxin module